MVDSPNDVRFYVYLYDLTTDTAYVGEAAFNVYSHDKLVKRFINMKTGGGKDLYSKSCNRRTRRPHFRIYLC